VTVKPEISLKAYKGLKATKKKVTVTAKEVDEELEVRREKVGRQVAVEGPVADKDTAVINFEGFVDGVAFPGGKGEDYPLVIGSGSFIPGFEEQLIGVEKGAEKDIVVTFPKEYHEESLAGKEAVFKCRVLDIKRTELPALDDELAKDISEFDTLDELKADIKEHIKAHKEEHADADYEEELMNKLADNIIGDIPEIMYENEVDYMVENFEDRLKTQGIDLDSYIKYTATSLETLRENFAPQAKQQVRIRLALETVAKEEGLTANEDELEAEYKTIAESYKMPVDRIKAIIPSDGLEKDIVVRKAIDFVKSSAVSGKDAADEKPAKAEKAPAKAPAKKPAAKAEEKPAAKPAAKKAPAKKSAPKKAE
ncbi:MAG: trigger factor, partial [Clostridia bacterium]|nr:trigger factor [Clostridia bacterium]